eukprot:TRINITY_DN1700_c3_g1_i1.p1 TRINITY_DN1700_c3_g1~~TRINITY_DN1700_c3_g1_i1.p1  ORF type:complete len:504 (-),score=165.57 TRINITY_DN1700_c3_g1_i1:142-1653(-)
MGRRERQRKRKLKKRKEDKIKSKIGKKKFNDLKNNNTSSQNKKLSKSVSYQDPNIKTILVVGDGDFSFTRGLIRHRANNSTGIIASSYDSYQTLLNKYPRVDDILENIEYLVTQNSNKKIRSDDKISRFKLLFSVDGTNLKKTFVLNKNDDVEENNEENDDDNDNQIIITKRIKIKLDNKFDRIIFNFPHVGKQRVHLNKNLMNNFFKSAKSYLSNDGEIHVTIKDKPPYSLWNITDQAGNHNFYLKSKLFWNIDDFPGYNHCTTLPNAKKFEAFVCRTYIYKIDHQKDNNDNDSSNYSNEVNNNNSDNFASVFLSSVDPKLIKELEKNININKDDEENELVNVGISEEIRNQLKNKFLNKNEIEKYKNEIHNSDDDNDVDVDFGKYVDYDDFNDNFSTDISSNNEEADQLNFYDDNFDDNDENDDDNDDDNELEKLLNQSVLRKRKRKKTSYNKNNKHDSDVKQIKKKKKLNPKNKKNNNASPNNNKNNKNNKKKIRKRNYN